MSADGAMAFPVIRVRRPSVCVTNPGKTGACALAAKRVGHPSNPTGDPNAVSRTTSMVLSISSAGGFWIRSTIPTTIFSGFEGFQNLPLHGCWRLTAHVQKITSDLFVKVVLGACAVLVPCESYNCQYRIGLRQAADRGDRGVQMRQCQKDAARFKVLVQNRLVSDGQHTVKFRPEPVADPFGKFGLRHKMSDIASEQCRR
jgi:hypothetical protein